MSETTVERLKRLNSSANKRAPIEAADVFWTRLACAIEETFGDEAQELSDYEIGCVVGGAVGRMMTHKKESQ
jgi:hypothetical protein